MKLKHIMQLIVILLILVACANNEPTPAPIDLQPTPRTTRATPSLTPTITATIVPTSTIIPPTPSPVPPHHEVDLWHEPYEGGHHHGINPALSPYYDLYMQATGNQQIGYPWLSSPFENVFPFPMGNHEGFKFLGESDTGCIQIDPTDQKPYNCIRGYLVLIHSMGTMHHLMTRIHSNYGVFEVCTLDFSQCGLVATGGLPDYGVEHAGYKREICQLPGDPPSYPYDTGPGLNRLPYRAAVDHSEKLPTTTENIEFWNSQGPGAGHIKFYPHRPNNILGLSWSAVDSWDYMDVSDCSNHLKFVAPCPDGSCALNGTAFQVFAIRIQHLPVARPFFGYTDVDGHVDPSCTDPSPICVPLIIEESVPQGDALLSRGVRQGKCDQVPCFEFDTGVTMYAPGYIP